MQNSWIKFLQILKFKQNTLCTYDLKEAFFICILKKEKKSQEPMTKLKQMQI